MPQIDLRPLFTPPSKDRRPCPDPFLVPAWKDPRSYTPTKPASKLKVSIAQATNVAFVLVACLGALVSVLYFIKGGELLQEVAAWPRELFYGRPASRPQTPAIKAPAITGSKDESGDPFLPASKLLGLNSSPAAPVRPNGPVPAPFSTSPSVFNKLGRPAPGGDAFSRGLTQGPPVSAQANTSSAKTAAQTATVKVQQHAVGPSKTTSARAQTATTRMRSSVGNSAAAAGTVRKVQASSQKTSGTAKTLAGSKSNVQPPASHSLTSSVKPAATSSFGQSAGALRSAAPMGHLGGGLGGATGLTSGHSFGRMGGR
jgi:hypothetical protein